MLLEDKNAVIYGAPDRSAVRWHEPSRPKGYIGGTQVAMEAVESMRRQLACELGPHGVRVVTLRTGGIPESIGTGFEGRDAIVEGIEKMTMLGASRDARGRGQCGGLRCLRPRADHDGGHRQHQLRRPDRVVGNYAGGNCRLDRGGPRSRVSTT